MYILASAQDVATGGGGAVGSGGQGCHAPPSIFEQNQVQQFQFQTSEILLLTAVQKLYGPKISRFSPCVLQFFGNILRSLIFSNYIGEKDQFTLVFLKRSDT